MRVTVTHTGIEEEKLRADRYHAAYRRRVWEAMNWFGQVVSQEIKADHPYKDRTGWLTASVGYSMDPLFETGTMSGTVYALAWYASAVEAGTPHSRPYPFFWPKFYKYLPALLDRIQRAGTEALAEVAA